MHLSKREPDVSVLLPVFNGERYLSAAIDSVLRQSHRNLELILVDDASTDGTAEIIRCQTDARIRPIRQPENGGVVKALNTALQRAKGRYIARIDTDDLWRPEKLARQLELLRARPEIALCGCFYTQIDALGRLIREVELPVSPEENYLQLFVRNTFVHSGVVFNAQVVRDLGGYSPDWLHIEDYALWLAIAETYPVCNMPESLLSYRIHDQSISSENASWQQQSVLKLRRLALQRCGISVSDALLQRIGRGSVPVALQPELKQVLDHILAHAPALLERRKLRELCQQQEQALVGGVPPFLRQRLFALLKGLTAQRVAFYAAGSFAETLLDCLDEQGLPYPQVMFDQFPERSPVTRVPVDRIENLPAYGIETLLITHEQLHAALLRELRGNAVCQGVEIVDPWVDDTAAQQ
ncbi:MAG: glycosyltransferase [Desulfuromonadaceae bacterium]|nr:glycosyltransferase [Desulfuromonadaceae bacterium]